MKITKDKFKQYETIKESGITNMFDIKIVMSLSNLTKEECLEIMKNYGKYVCQFGYIPDNKSKKKGELWKKYT